MRPSTGLGEAAWAQPHRWARVAGADGIGRLRPELVDPDRLTVKVKNWEGGRMEGVCQWTNLQRVLNASDPDVRPRGRRVAPVERSEDDVERARSRARQTVRSICMAMQADRMVTFTTRAVVAFDVLLVRFQRFCRSYERAVKGKWLHLAVPELHADRSGGDHFHLHVACNGFFDLARANRLWWALCAPDDLEHDRNGNLDVKVFRPRHRHEDVVSIIAGYISKYVGKALDSQGFNRRSYWASRVKREEVRQIVLDARSANDALFEIAERFGIVWTSVLLGSDGCFFVLPGESGFWFKVLPLMSRRDAPF